jgi:hypothetical protein
MQCALLYNKAESYIGIIFLPFLSKAGSIAIALILQAAIFQQWQIEYTVEQNNKHILGI